MKEGERDKQTDRVIFSDCGDKFDFILFKLFSLHSSDLSSCGSSISLAFDYQLKNFNPELESNRETMHLLAQLVEHWTCYWKFAGTNPSVKSPCVILSSLSFLNVPDL